MGSPDTDLALIYEKYKGLKGSGDKGSTHSYIQIYQLFLAPYRNCKAVYEIGVAKGLSLRMWAEYFPEAMIYGVDFSPPEIDHPRIKVFEGDGTTFDPGFPLDVIIDDGSHREADQKASLELLWPRLNPGGIYFIEDLYAPFGDFVFYHGRKTKDDGLAWKIK